MLAWPAQARSRGVDAGCPRMWRGRMKDGAGTGALSREPVEGWSADVAKSEREKMLAGEWYTCMDAELDALRERARAAVHEHNTMDPAQRGAMGQKLAALFKGVGAGVFIEAPVFVTYGGHITLGEGVYFNAGVTILDTAPVSIGAGSMLGPNVQIYCAQHHRDPALRAEGLEIAEPVSVGRNVWLGGGAIVLPGVTIGDDAIVGAGSVVVRDVAPGATVVGNPARQIKAGALPAAPQRKGKWDV